MTRTAVALLVALPGLHASAEIDPLLGRGTNDLSLEVSPDFEGVVGDMLTLRAGYGRFIRDRIALRLIALYETIEDVAPGEKDYRARGLCVAGEYNFDHGGRLGSYAGLQIGYRWLHYLEFEDSALVYGPLTGLKLFIADNAALDISLAFKMAGDDVYVNDFQREDTDLTAHIGFRVMF